jgi:acyl-CoA synthetase (NDP forming)
VRSLPGRYDTLFIPSHKLTFKADHVAPLALLSQSGAFAVARASKLESFNPTYIITFGNQADLTLGDYLTYLEADPRISVFACYIEGFRTLDGQRFLEATRKITASGRAVILYRAGRTHAGASAAASHTASVAGSYRVACELTRGAGGLVAESLEDFEDLVRTFTLLAGRRPSGLRLGAISNAGFESVAIGDNLGELDLATLGSETRSRLTDLFLHHRVGTIVAPRNPLDVTPVLGDEAFAQASRAILEDPEVDIGVIGCVPLTGALQTLPVGKGHDENLTTNVSVIQRLITLWHDELKPWVAVIDAGRLYDPAASALHEAGIPTFRSVDRALRALGTWTLFHLKQRSLPGPR